MLTDPDTEPCVPLLRAAPQADSHVIAPSTLHGELELAFRAAGGIAVCSGIRHPGMEWQCKSQTQAVFQAESSGAFMPAPTLCSIMYPDARHSQLLSCGAWLRMPAPTLHCHSASQCSPAK